MKTINVYPSPQTSRPSSPVPIPKIKKRKSIPQRSLPYGKIIRLDVYTTYLKNPSSLFCPKLDMSLYKNTQGAPTVTWKKGGALHISPTEDKYDQLTPEELKTISILRVLPTQYLYIKETILTRSKTSTTPIKKRDAKSWFRIDVNKVGLIDEIAILFDWFRSLGWIPDSD